MKENKFHYHYVAPTEEERKEIAGIRNQYVQERTQESKLERLRRLDSCVKNVAKGVGLTLGVVGTLVFGLGLAMVLEWRTLWGILVASVGGAITGLAYPVFSWVLKRNKKKYGGEILRLSEELLSDEA